MAQVKPLSTQDVEPQVENQPQPPQPATQPLEQLNDKKPVEEQTTKG